MEPLLFLCPVWFLSILTAFYLGAERGRDVAGMLLGIFLGPLGAIFTGLLPRTAKNEALHRHEVERELAVLRAALERDRQRRAAGPARVVRCAACGASHLSDGPAEPAAACENCGSKLSGA